jgi:hypothetical protein
MSWLYYLVEANIYLGVFYLAYCIFLNKETYYTINRVYLLLICAVAFILPVIQLDFLKPTVYATTGQTYIPVIAESFTWQDGLLYSYLTGVIIFAIQFIIKLYQLQKLASSKPAYEKDNYKLIYLEGSNAAFSFFNYLFIGIETAEPELIVKHELVHIRQKHSADVFMLELLKIISWFNPAIYLLQNSVKAVHEYIADEQTALTASDNITYATFLVNNAYGISGPSFTHSFFNYNLLKNRIIMLHQKRSGSLARLKYLVAVPLCAGLLCESTLGFSKDYGFINIGDNLSTTAQDTIKRKLPALGKVTKVTHIPATKNHPAVTVSDVKLVPPQKVVISDKAPRPNVNQVKFPPPVVISDKAPKPNVNQVKFPPPAAPKKGVKITRVTLLPPPPPPTAPVTTQKEPVTEIQIVEPAPKKPLNEVTINTNVATKKAPLTEIRIETKKAPLTEVRIEEPVSQPNPQKKP